MTRIDMRYSDWQKLITPVIPHAASTKDPSLNAIRIEVADRAMYAIATDQTTLAAERHPLRERTAGRADPVHISSADAKASAALFRPGDDDPPLQVIIDTVSVPVTIAGTRRSVDQLAITLQAGDGTRLALHDRRDPNADPLSGWRKVLAGVMARPLAGAAPALGLAAAHLPKWGKAVRGGERLCVYTGSTDSHLVLIMVGDHFAGTWAPVNYLDSAAEVLAASPWRGELDGALADDHTARFNSACYGCGNTILEGDQIRSGGSGGWLCESCGDDDE